MEDISHEKKSPVLKENYYEVKLNGLEIDRLALKRFMDTDYFPIIKKKHGNERVINARDLIKSLNFLPPNSLRLAVKHIEGPNIKPIDIVMEIFQLNDNNIKDIKILKTKQVIG